MGARGGAECEGEGVVGKGGNVTFGAKVGAVDDVAGGGALVKGADGCSVALKMSTMFEPQAQKIRTRLTEKKQQTF